MKNKQTLFWSERIPYIKKMKEFYSKIDYEGINLWPIMAGDIYTHYYFSHIDKGEEPNTKEKILIGLKSLFFRDNFPIKGKGKILISYFMPRQDHHELVGKAVSNFQKKDLTWIDAYDYKKRKIFLRGKIKFPNILLLFNIWNNFRKSKLKKTLKNYYWFYILKTYFRYNQIKELKKIIDKIDPKAYIAFCSSAFGEESILTLLCKKKGIPTFTLQHGFFHNSSDPFASVIVLNENTISDYHLIWGENSKNPLKKYLNPSSLIIVGNPKYKKVKIKPRKKFNPKKATIFFSVPGFNEGNRKLLKIVKEFIKNHPEIEFNVTVHPMNDMKIFSKEIKSKNVKFIGKEVLAQDLLEKSDFVILYNTTVTIEALNYKIPIFRYAGKDFRDFWDTDDKFTNLKELEKIFSSTKNQKYYKKLMNFYDNELKETFYFDSKKDVPEVYRDKIIKIVDDWNKK